MLAILLIQAALCYGFGLMVGDTRQGWVILPMWRSLALLTLALLSCGGALDVAQAATTQITFDDQPAGTAIIGQYHTQGLDLATASGGFQATVLSDPENHSGPNVLDISFKAAPEFPSGFVRGLFVNPHHTTVSLWVHGRGVAPSPLTGTTTLNAFDLSGQLVATQTVLAPPPGAGFALLSVFSSGGSIASFTVSCDNDLISVDDLSFDAVDAVPGADFALFGGPVQLSLGGSGGTRILLRRFNGSTGNVLYNVDQLPPGVSVTSALPNPMSGPDNSASDLVLSADPSATPVIGWPARLNGLPDATSGHYGAHSSTFSIDILDSYDAQIVGIEVTQGVQVYDLPKGSVGNGPLHGIPVRYQGVGFAAGGRTVVGAFPNFASFPLHSLPPLFNCALAGTSGGTPLPGSPLTTVPLPKGPIAGVNYVDDTNRAHTESVCNFVLPESWTHGVISLTATLSEQPQFGPPVSLDCCTDNNSFTLTDIPFTPTREVSLSAFALRVNDSPLGSPALVFEEARNLLPLGDNQFHIGSGYAQDIDVTDIWNQDVKACGFLGLESCSEDSTGRGASAMARVQSLADDLNFENSGDLVVGIYPQSDSVSGQQDRIRGLTSTSCSGPFWDCDGIPAIVVQETKRPITAVAHELGHLLGRPHASFACGAGDTDNNGAAEHWPPDEQGFLQGVGVDRRSFRVLFPDRTGGGLGGPFYDFMSYCPKSNESAAWISTKGWMEELTTLAVGPPGSGASKQSAVKRTPPSGTESVVVVQAFIDQHDNVTFGKIAAVRRTPLQSPVPPSEYHVQAFDPRQRLIAESPMRISVGHTDGTVHIIFLNAAISARDVDAIQITRQGHPIARRNRPPHAPEVEHVRVKAHHHSGQKDDADQPDRSPRTMVTWHTEHGSAMSTTVKLDYSVDSGQTWRPIFMGPDRGRASLRPQLLTPSLHARIRVRVSDGFNEVSAVSPVFRHLTAATLALE